MKVWSKSQPDNPFTAVPGRQGIRNSIRARMTLSFACILCILILCVCSGMIWYARHAAESSADTLLRGVSEQVRGDMSAHGRLRNPDELVAEEREDLLSSNLSLTVVDAQGRVITQTQRNAPVGAAVGRDWRAVAIPFNTDTAIVALPWRQTENALRAQAFGLLVLGLFVTGVGAIGAWLLVGRTLSPISLLSRQARVPSAGNLGARLELPSQDAEIVELVTTLNGLLARQAEAVNARGRFHAAASHELRTPLQALSGHLELALQRPRTAEGYHAVVEEAYRQTRRLTALTKDLLLLNQLHSMPVRADEAVDLAEICTAALSTCAPMVQAGDLQVETVFAANSTVTAASTHVEMLARNLIENAVKYADAGGIVRLRVLPEPNGIEMEIFNSCPPLPNWDPEKLCEPFYRPDASRNSQTGGSGLGLAICKAICDVNGWQMTLSQENQEENQEGNQQENQQRNQGVTSRVRFV